MSDHSFASLVPANAVAKLALSNLFEALTSGYQNNQADNAQALLNRLTIKPERTYCREICRLRLAAEKSRPSRSAYANDGEMSDSTTEPDTPTETSNQELGMIWEAYYRLDLESLPLLPENGWRAGKGLLEDSYDLVLCTKAFAKLYNINLRNPHARFNFAADTGGFYIVGCSRSPSAQLRVNGEAATQKAYHLNQHRMRIQFDKLEYEFQWTEFAAKDDFKLIRRRYITNALNGPQFTAIDMPTPQLNTRTIGKWTLGDALGAGGDGRVFFASNTSGNVVAIKVVERTSLNYHRVDREIKTLQKVTNFAEKSDKDERILRMADVIYSSGEKFSSQTVFDNVGMVLQPMTPQTFVNLVGTRNKEGSKGMTMEAASAFRGALLGVKVMHNGDWLHGDLKPANIGLLGTPLRSVLLDVGSSKQLSVGCSLQPKPGTFGTVGYLAPELELENYDHSVDIWAMGIILFELTYGYHPWKFAFNPWRDREDNLSIRPLFRERYQKAIDKMTRDYNSARGSPASGYIHLGGLFIEMVRYKWAQKNRAQRPNIDEVLQHPAWGPLLPESSQVKRRRVDI